MHELAPKILIIFSLCIGAMNLFIPFITKNETTLRNALMISASLFFLYNVIIIDWLFIQGFEFEVVILDFGKHAISFHIEALGLIFLTLLSVLWNIAILYTIKYLSLNEIVDSNRFLFFMNASVLCGVFISLSSNLFTMFVGYELLTICTIPLIAHKINETVVKGLFSYINLLMLSSLVLFLPAIVIIYSICGDGEFIYGGFIKGHFSPAFAKLLLLMLFFGVAKAASYPFHFWLPAAMVASYPVSALLHAVVVVKTGLFCIYKIILYVFGLEYLQELFADYNWFIIFPVFTIFYSSIQSIRYNEIKKILAYSTINQLSISLLSAVLFTEKGMNAAIIHMVSHSFTKISLFYAAGSIYSIKNAYHIKDLSGLSSSMPKTSMVMLIAGLSLIGIPPLGGFISKFLIIRAAVESENLLVLFTLSVSTLFSALYVMKIIILLYGSNSSIFVNNNVKNAALKDTELCSRTPEKKLPKMMLLSLFICIISIVFFYGITILVNELLAHI